MVLSPSTTGKGRATSNPIAQGGRVQETTETLVKFKKIHCQGGIKVSHSCISKQGTHLDSESIPNGQKWQVLDNVGSHFRSHR